MAENHENQGFKVVDRRVSAEQEPPAAQQPAPVEAAAPGKEQVGEKEQVEGPGWKMHAERPQQPLPPMDFTTFCLSLASSTIIHLGETPHPDSGKTEPNLPLAKQSIDILALLEEKTRGNLTAEESRLLATLLYDLRMRFVQAQQR